MAMQTQARICPICIDDHSAERECLAVDLKDRVLALLRASEVYRHAHADSSARIAELEAEVERLVEAARVVVNESRWEDRSSVRTTSDFEYWRVPAHRLRTLRAALDAAREVE
jgi:hypothetical protein